jgi:8-oxo-dGTP pyrophosphatase MutT (NUDIX family)
MLIEATAGLLDKASPEDCIKAEAEEETGYCVTHVRKVFEAFMSPGSVTEALLLRSGVRQHFQSNIRRWQSRRGEDIEVLELSLEDAMTAIESGAIQDGKTIMLPQHTFIHLFQQKEATA